MKIYYDDEVDALYIKLSNDQPEGVIEVTEGLNIDTTTDNMIGWYRNSICFKEDRHKNISVLFSGVRKRYLIEDRRLVLQRNIASHLT
jgi:hypothetical protein